MDVACLSQPENSLRMDDHLDQQSHDQLQKLTSEAEGENFANILDSSNESQVCKAFQTKVLLCESR